VPVERQREGREAVDPSFAEAIGSLIAKIDIASIAVPFKGHRLPRDIHNYHVFAVVPRYPKPDPFEYTGDHRYAHSESDGKSKVVFLDAQYTLAYGTATVPFGVSSAGYRSKDGAITSVGIVQSQGLWKADQATGYLPKELNSGFRWRDTLVVAWKKIAEEVGASALTMVSSATAYERSSPSASFEPFVAAYDDVAERMEFVPQSPYNPRSDWVLSLA
jgi:hypothetical protein